MPRAGAQPTYTDHQPGALAHFWLYAVAVERNVSPNMAHSNMRGAHNESRRDAVSDHRIPVQKAVWEFYRRRMGEASRWGVLRRPLADHRRALHIDPAFARGRYRTGA